MFDKITGFYHAVENAIPTDAIAASARQAGKGMALAAGYAVPSIIACGLIGAITGAAKHYSSKDAPLAAAPAAPADADHTHYREAA